MVSCITEATEESYGSYIKSYESINKIHPVWNFKFQTKKIHHAM